MRLRSPGQARLRCEPAVHPARYQPAPNEWNEIEFLFDAEHRACGSNYGAPTGGVADEGYGPIALYVGGTGEVEVQGYWLQESGNEGPQCRPDLSGFPQAADQRFLLFDDHSGG